MGNCLKQRKLQIKSQCTHDQVTAAQRSDSAHVNYIDASSPELSVFDLEKLESATGSFSDDHCVGRGSFGPVYSGFIESIEDDGASPAAVLPVAVKKINHCVFPGFAELLVGLNNVTGFSHPNLARLIGYCSESDQHLIVSEYLSKGSLDDHLYRKSSTYESLTWGVRIQIALGAANALAFLHSQQPPVTYMNLKSSNILLSHEYGAKLSIFGLVMGRHSYIVGSRASDYGKRGISNANKSDVYNFGIILLQILTGREVLDKEKKKGEQSLVEWAMPYLIEKRKMLQIMDNRIGGQNSKRCAYMVAMLAFYCLLNEEDHRPHMNAVVRVLEMAVCMIKLREDHQIDMQITTVADSLESSLRPSLD
ncbi:probable serine/threonine-protein kinase PBL11 [Aristolochia californica]|uniref:probable serine/threonine-protein kinase PBL11 n=1 Tax=Aristolochia californica TaxID=171875 RepID=UPI0035DE0DCC